VYLIEFSGAQYQLFANLNHAFLEVNFMNDFLKIETLGGLLAEAWMWMQAQVLVLSNLEQLGVILLFAIAAWMLVSPLRRLIVGLKRAHAKGIAILLYDAAALTIFPLTWLTLVWVSSAVAANFDWPSRLLTIAVSLLTAWVVIRIASMLVRDPIWSRLISVVAWSIAALNILGLYGPAVALLDKAAFQLGSLRISALTLISAAFTLIIFLWVAILLSRLFEQRVRAASNLTPSTRELFAKLIKFAFVFIAIVAGLAGVGIDLTAFAVVGGAIGVGIGFGLQKIVSNLFSGIILLMDRSIKPGDVISVGQTFGWVNSLSARYVSVLTRDGIEHLIPNEELVINRVENWSYSNQNVRLRIPIGVHYKSDIRKAISLCLEAAAETERVLKNPEPNCLVRGFGDSSVDLEIRIWISDPPKGRANVISDVLLKVWDKFHQHGVEIPYPQRDVHLRTIASAQVPPQPLAT
jgi:small-conductance mechanosensitive channel